MNAPTDIDWAGRHVLIVGDVMLDRYVYGDVERISPEAPIPVLRRTRETRVAGGAANVARNVVALGGRATLVGVVGRDPNGEVLSVLCEQAGIATALVRCDRMTTEKVRFVAGGQQLLRADGEEASALVGAQDALVGAARAAIAEADVVVLSDYAKGVLTADVLSRVIATARERDVPVVVDPKQKDFSLYRGATVVTPNRSEIRAAVGTDPADDDAAVRAGSLALSAAEARAVLVTRGADGMTLVERAGSHHLRSRAREVFDVSGAGDTVVACLALALAAGQPVASAAGLANAAAGVAVSKLGTATVGLDELREALSIAADAAVPACLESAVRAREVWRQRGLRVGFTNGCFDLLHPGHVHLLRAARAECDRLVVGLNSDASVTALKGPGRPVRDAHSRAAVLAALRSVDLVVTFDEPTPRRLVETLVPDVLVKGSDYAKHQVVGSDVVEAAGGEVVLVDLLEGHSTTRTVDAMTRLFEAS
jgi:D-beta-D-heptose 7-phosphate kinase/D-beta-D-heptose 1-phosphate adenosyltransferase